MILMKMKWKNGKARRHETFFKVDNISASACMNLSASA